MVNKKQYFRYQIIFLWHNGYIPKLIDHADRDTLNDKIENLREATPSQNNRNTTSRKNASSKYLGVQKNEKHNSWRVFVKRHDAPPYIGSFKTEEEAALVFNKFAVKYYGEFANLNTIKPVEKN